MGTRVERETKHTPGPQGESWHLTLGDPVRHHDGTVHFKVELGEYSGHRDGEYMRFSGIGTPRRARIAAAAPELLDALTTAADELGQWLAHATGESDRLPDRSAGVRAVRTAEEVRARATGQED